MASLIKMQQEPIVDDDTKWAKYEAFIESHLQSAENTQRFIEMIQSGQKRFPVNLDALRRVDQDFVSDLIREPVKLLSVMQSTIQRIGEQYSSSEMGGKKQTSAIAKPPQYRISFEGNLGRNHVTPRGLIASLVNNLVAVQGIVTRMSLVRPKLLKSVHYTEKTNLGLVRDYHDTADPQELTKLEYSSVVPRKDDQGNPMTMEYGYSQFRDCQTIVLQELPERTPTGLLPRSVEVTLQQDLVDMAKPGDRITIIGIYKCFATGSTQGDGSFRSSLLGLSVHKLSSESDDYNVSKEDVTLIHKISQKQNILEYMGKSIAPSIYGHDWIKKAVLLMLLGGSEKNLSTGTHLRGDINMLFIGDPSTAKSQMLRYIMTIAPLSVTTTGRGSSSVGLTAAVRRDQESGENVLEAGAMVLADGGVVLIDEFDKMNEADRVAIHEVMEQQTVTIAKAGIHCSLNARCSVVAAANPIYGEYQKDLPPTKNIGLPDSLLSRFDLLFIVLDSKVEAIDRKVAERVTKNHRYRGPGDNQGQTGQQDSYIVTQAYQIKQEQGPFVSFQSNLYSSDVKDLISQTFLKKYISYAKRTITETVLDDESIDMITQEWVHLRQQDINKGAIRILPITIRSLESLIRLASAHAKLRLSRRVTVEDCKVAIELMRFTLDQNDDEEPQGGNDDNDNGGDQPPQYKIEQPPMEREVQKKESVSKKKTSLTQGIKRLKIDDEEVEVEKHISFLQMGSVEATQRDKNEVFKALFKHREETNADLVDIDVIWEMLSKDKKVKDYNVFLKALVELEANGKVFLDHTKKEVQLY